MIWTSQRDIVGFCCDLPRSSSGSWPIATSIFMLKSKMDGLLKGSPKSSDGASTSYQSSPSPTWSPCHQRGSIPFCCLSRQGSGTKNVQGPFAVCVAFFLFVYWTLWALGWGGGLPQSWQRSSGMCRLLAATACPMFIDVLYLISVNQMSWICRMPHCKHSRRSLQVWHWNSKIAVTGIYQATGHRWRTELWETGQP